MDFERDMDPCDQEDIEARKAAIHAAKVARLSAGLSEVMSADDLNKVLPVVPNATWAAANAKRHQARLIRQSGPTPTKCPACNARVNSFDGRCVSCSQPAPRSFDLKPISIRKDSPMIAVTTRAPSPQVSDQVIATPPAPKSCKTCSEPLSTNGRCYRCRPGGRRGVASKEVRKAPRPATASRPDPELAAIASLMTALSDLDVKSARRTVSYVCERLNLGSLSTAEGNAPR